MTVVPSGLTRLPSAVAEAEEEAVDSVVASAVAVVGEGSLEVVAVAVATAGTGDMVRSDP